MRKVRDMQVTVSAVLDDGTIMEGVAELRPGRLSAIPKPPTAAHPSVSSLSSPAPIDFDLGVRPFMKEHGAKLSAPEKLILLVAHFAKGDVGTSVARAAVVNQWGKMKPIMGGKYNGAYDTRARDTSYLTSPKAGLFQLRPGWEKIFK